MWAQLFGVLCFRESNKTAVKVWAKAKVYLKVWLGKGSHPGSQDCRQGTVPQGLLNGRSLSLIGCGTEAPSSTLLWHISCFIKMHKSREQWRESASQLKATVLHNLITKSISRHLYYILLDKTNHRFCPHPKAWIPGGRDHWIPPEKLPTTFSYSLFYMHWLERSFKAWIRPCRNASSNFPGVSYLMQIDSKFFTVALHHSHLEQLFLYLLSVPQIYPKLSHFMAFALWFTLPKVVSSQIHLWPALRLIQRGTPRPHSKPCYP